MNSFWPPSVLCCPMLLGCLLLAAAAHTATAQTSAAPATVPVANTNAAVATTNPPAATPMFPGGVAQSHEKPRPVKTALSGAELYSMHCNRCHPERYPTERTAAQWKTILLHMRVRANLPASQARTILKYLQDNSGR